LALIERAARRVERRRDHGVRGVLVGEAGQLLEVLLEEAGTEYLELMDCE
jgi:hypothetical protein